jgi:hypothetical protein
MSAAGGPGFAARRGGHHPCRRERFRQSDRAGCRVDGADAAADRGVAEQVADVTVGRDKLKGGEAKPAAGAP